MMPRQPPGIGLVADEHIFPPFPAESRVFAMAGNEADIVAEDEQPVTDRIDQLRQAAVAMFPGADGAAEQYVADEGLAHAVVEIGDMTLGVAGAMKDIDPLGAQLDHVAMLQPARRDIGPTAYA